MHLEFLRLRQKVARKIAHGKAEAGCVAKAAGATPIRVTLPVKGTHFKLQKILALPGDKLWFEVGYTGWKVAR